MKTFYHGTQKLFDRFDMSHAKEGSGIKFGIGVYVAEVYKSAAHYAATRHQEVRDDIPYYVYTVEVPDLTEDNYLFSCRPVNAVIVERAEEKLGEAIPDQATKVGKYFRKYIGNKLLGRKGTVRQLCDSKDFESEKAAREFLLGIGVTMLVWPHDQKHPDGPEKRAIIDDSLVRITKIEQVKLDSKAQFVPGSNVTVKEF